MAHGTLNQPAGINMDVHWQLTVLSSINDLFHACDNGGACKELPFQPAYKLHIDEIFLPNRRNILGGLLISVTKHEAISFRTAATSPDNVKDSGIQRKGSKPLSAGKNRSTTKLKDFKPVLQEPKQYCIEVTAPSGWPLTLAQWKRVDVIRNSNEHSKLEAAPKKLPTKEKSVSAKGEKLFTPQEPSAAFELQADDAYIELECSLVVMGCAYAKRDDKRDLEFLAARRAWDAKEPGRNSKGAHFRKEFRAEFMEALPVPPSESALPSAEELEEELQGEEEKKEEQLPVQQGPTPASESGMIEMSVEAEEEAKYLMMPEQLKDKFVPLYFLPFCMKEKDEEESVFITPDMAEAAKKDRHARIEAASERMRQLQQYNEIFVLDRQKNRCHLLEKLFTDSQWCPELAVVLEQRDDAIALETLERALSSNKKKLDLKVKK